MTASAAAPASPRMFRATEITLPQAAFDPGSYIIVDGARCLVFDLDRPTSPAELMALAERRLGV
jgi:hypothetical protein